MVKKLNKVFISVLFITIVTQILNMLKSILLAKDFGTAQILDSFYLSNIFTVTVFNVIGVAITTIMIPEFSVVDNSKNKKKSIEQYLTILYLVVICFVLTLLLIVNLGVDIFTPKFDPVNKELFISLTSILSIAQIFRVQTAFSTAIAQSEGSFILPKIATFFSALLPIIYLFFTKETSVINLAWCIVAGYVCECLLLFINQYKQKEYRFVLNFPPLEKHTKKLLVNTIPIIVSSTVFQLQLIVSNYTIGFFGEGFISIFSNTNQIIGIFQLLFISNIITIVYPKIAKEVSLNLKLSIKKISQYIIYTNCLIILLVWGYISLGQDLVDIMFLRGNFSKADSLLVYQFGIFLIIALPISVIRDYFYRFLYSIDQIKLPTKNAIQTVIINIFLIIILYKIVGAYSVVVAPLIGTIISTINIYFKLKKLGFEFNAKSIINNFLVFNFFGFLMTIFLSKIVFDVNSTIINFGLKAIIGGGFYSIICVVYYRIMIKRMEKYD